MHEWDRIERLILFDGICNWCNAWVNFTIDHDPHAKLRFGTLQSESAQQLLKTLRLPTKDFETFLLLEHGHIYTKSTAALRIVKQLSGFWPFFYLGILFPRPLRDAITSRAIDTSGWANPTPAVCRLRRNADDSCEAFPRLPTWACLHPVS